MSEDLVLQIGADAIKIMIYLAGPMLFAAMAIGLLVSVFQAVTQINESTLTFIPKMIAIILVLVVMAPWMIEHLRQYTTEVLTQAGEFVR